MIADMLRAMTPAQIIHEGYAAELEAYLEANQDTLPDEVQKAIMKALKIIP